MEKEVIMSSDPRKEERFNRKRFWKHLSKFKNLLFLSMVIFIVSAFLPKSPGSNADRIANILDNVGGGIIASVITAIYIDIRSEKTESKKLKKRQHLATMRCRQECELLAEIICQNVTTKPGNREEVSKALNEISDGFAFAIIANQVCRIEKAIDGLFNLFPKSIETDIISFALRKELEELNKYAARLRVVSMQIGECEPGETENLQKAVSEYSPDTKKIGSEPVNRSTKEAFCVAMDNLMTAVNAVFPDIALFNT